MKHKAIPLADSDLENVSGGIHLSGGGPSVKYVINAPKAESAEGASGISPACTVNTAGMAAAVAALAAGLKCACGGIYVLDKTGKLKCSGCGGTVDPGTRV